MSKPQIQGIYREINTVSQEVASLKALTKSISVPIGDRQND